jgi:hypothetical protein
VEVPVNFVRDGFLEEASVTLPWTESFATFPGGDPIVDNEELQVTVGGQPRIARLRGLAAGAHKVGLRPSWPGPGVLVIRPAGHGGPPHVVPLASLEIR